MGSKGETLSGWGRVGISMSAPDSSASPDSIDIGVSAGDVLAGKYRVERVLGAGGMGVVVAAHHIHLDEKVALKFLLPAALSNAEAIARFEREARAAVKIKSEHVARVSDVGKLENGSPYMVMEYLEGCDLAALLEQCGTLPIDEAVEFVLQACEAVAEAHAIGIVHRDLKPANLFCIRRADGRLSVKLLDFGISKLTTGDTQTNMTRTTTVMGSPTYMSPEQLQSTKHVDARSDIWAIGVILFELVSGRTPFEAEAMTELVIKIATQPPVPLRAVLAAAPEGFEQVILRCLQRDVDARYANVAELARALEPFAPKRARTSIERILGTITTGASRVPVAPSARTPAALAATQQPAVGWGTAAAWGTGTGSSAPRRRRAVLGWALGITLLLVVGGGIVLAKRGTTSAERPSTTADSVTPQPATQAAPIVPVQPTTPEPPAVPAPTQAEAPAAAAPPTPAPTAPVPAEPDAHATAPARVAPAPPHPVHHAPRTPSTAPAAALPPAAAPAVAKPSCDPPYYYDANGTRVFKKECL